MYTCMHIGMHAYKCTHLRAHIDMHVNKDVSIPYSQKNLAKNLIWHFGS